LANAAERAMMEQAEGLAQTADIADSPCSIEPGRESMPYNASQGLS